MTPSTPSSPQVLVVEDDHSLRDTLLTHLQREGYSCLGVPSSGEALTQLERAPVPIVLTDLKLPEGDALAFIRQVRDRHPESHVILMTAFGNTKIVLDAIRAGAYGYLSKPFTVEELTFLLRRLEETEELRAENHELRSVVGQRHNFSSMIAESSAMKDVLETVKRLSAFNTTVLIVGESGTGKELLARAIHFNSPRRGKPFVAINCGAIPEALMESELFGHKKGAFTDATRDKRGLFEEASGGTLFLDEIGELPLHLQVKLLRALQEQQIRRVGDEQTIAIDVRVVAATLRDLEQDVKTGRFRDDLFYRLNVVSLRLPPLRERQEDIPALAQHFLKKHGKRLGVSVAKIHPDAMKGLLSYGWRGNIRELENCIERGMVLSESDVIMPEALPEAVRSAGSTRAATTDGPMISDGNLSIKQHARSLEITLIRRALQKTKGNRTHAAKILEISHRALLYKLKEYDLNDL